MVAEKVGACNPVEELREELEKARRRLADLQGQLRALEEAPAGDAETIRQKVTGRAALLEGIAVEREVIAGLERAIAEAEEEARRAEREELIKRRKKAKPKVKKLVDRLKELAGEFGEVYGELRNVAEDLEAERLAGPAIALPIAAVLARHNLAHPKGALDVEATQLSRWAGMTKPDLEAEAEALTNLITGVIGK